MRYRPFLLVFSALVGSATYVAGQQPAPKEDETPLARPEPLCTVTAAEPSGLLNRLRQLAENDGFTINRISGSAGEMEAVKPDGPNSEDYDKVLLWIERDLNRQDALKIYLLYGRFEKVWGKVPPVRRVKVDEAREASRIGHLKKQLVALSDGGH